jgi:hypothetical protein
MNEKVVRYAVQREPFWREYSLLTGKRTGKMRKSKPEGRNASIIGACFQMHSKVFPAVDNRE